MSNETTIYNNIIYPNSSFVFDKIYPNYKTACENVGADGVLVGRYVLVSYTDYSLTQDQRTVLETYANGGALNWGNVPEVPSEVRDAYCENFLADGKKS